MAFNINQFGNAVKMAITNNSNLVIPPGWHGWHYDANLDTYKKVDGNNVESISAEAVRQYGGIPQALAAASMGNQIGATVKPAKGDLRWNNGGFQEQYDGHNWNRVAPTGPVGSPTGGLSYSDNAIGANGAAGPYSMASGFKPASTITMQGKLGDVTINLDTGELTMPPGVGRDAAIRDFWLGFQEHFQPTHKVKYEATIRQLEQELAQTKNTATLLREADTKAAHKRVAEKVAKKYAGEKFIMIKPEDLVKFIQEA